MQGEIRYRSPKAAFSPLAYPLAFGYDALDARTRHGSVKDAPQ